MKMTIEQRKEMEGFAFAAGAAAATWATAGGALAFLPGVGTVPAIIGLVGGASLGAVSLMANELAKDPPRMDFDQVSNTSEIELDTPSMDQTRLLEVRELGQCAHQFLGRTLRQLSAMECLLSSLERIQGIKIIEETREIHDETNLRKRACDCKSLQQQAVSSSISALVKAAQDLIDLCPKVNGTWSKVLNLHAKSMPILECFGSISNMKNEIRSAYKLDELGIVVPEQICQVPETLVGNNFVDGLRFMAKIELPR